MYHLALISVAIGFIAGFIFCLLVNKNNKQLRERLKKLTAELNELKKKYEPSKNEHQTDRMVQSNGNNEATEKRDTDKTS